MNIRRFRVLLLCLGLSALGGACKKLSATGGQCNFNSDCEDNLVCAGSFCRATCNPMAANPDRDCPTGFRCRSSGPQNMSRPVCLPPGEQGYCAYHSECPEPLVCVNGRCDCQCRTDRDCQLFDPMAQCVSIGEWLQACSFRDGGVRDVQASFNDSQTPDAGSPKDAGSTTDAATTLDASSAASGS